MHACSTDHNNERWYLFDTASREVTAKQTFHLPADLSCQLCTVQVRGCDLYSAKSPRVDREKGPNHTPSCL